METSNDDHGGMKGREEGGGIGAREGGREERTEEASKGARVKGGKVGEEGGGD